MTEPEATQQDTELNPESPADEAPDVTTDVATDETSADERAGGDDETAGFDAEAAQEGVTADYQERIREFDEVESVPVTSVPVPSSELDDSDLEVQAPGGQSG